MNQNDRTCSSSGDSVAFTCRLPSVPWIWDKEHTKETRGHEGQGQKEGKVGSFDGYKNAMNGKGLTVNMAGGEKNKIVKQRSRTQYALV